MRSLLTFSFFLINLATFGQRDSLFITTHLEVDSICNRDLRVEYTRLNDTTLLLAVERNTSLEENLLNIYTRKRIYQTSTPNDPVSFFPCEWSVRDPKLSVNMWMNIDQGKAINVHSDCSVVQTWAPMRVTTRSGRFIKRESTGIYVYRPSKRQARKWADEPENESEEAVD